MRSDSSYGRNECEDAFNCELPRRLLGDGPGYLDQYLFWRFDLYDPGTRCLHLLELTFAVC